MAVGGAVKLLVGLAFLMPASIGTEIPVLPKAEVALELAPALLGVGLPHRPSRRFAVAPWDTPFMACAKRTTAAR